MFLVDCGLDLVFLVDESGSVGQDNFDILKDFMNRIIQHLNIGPRDNQVGIATYASTAQREFDLDSYSTKTSLIHAVRNISYNHSGLSFVSRGLRLGSKSFFQWDPRGSGQSPQCSHYSNRRRPTGSLSCKTRSLIPGKPRGRNFCGWNLARWHQSEFD